MFFQYLKEFYTRVFLSILCWIFTFAVCLIYKDFILFTVLKPIINYSYKTDKEIYFIYTSFLELILSYIKIIYFISNLIAYLFIFYQVSLFLAPGLYDFEYKNILVLFYFNVFLIIVGFEIMNSFIIPQLFNYYDYIECSLERENYISLFFEARIIEYLNLYVTIYYYLLLIGQLYILIYLFIIKYAKNIKIFLRVGRKFFYWIFIFISTICSTPDATTQILLSLFLISLFELLIIFILLRKNYFA